MNVQPTPRVLPEHLHAFLSTSPSFQPNMVAKTVRMLGSVAALRGESATLSCGSHGEVPLLLHTDAHMYSGRMYDVVGKVIDIEGVAGLRVLGAVDGGETKDVDYKIFEDVVDVTHQFKDIFYD